MDVCGGAREVCPSVDGWLVVWGHLEAIAIRVEVIASTLEAIAVRVEAIANRLEAIATWFEAIASRLEIASRLWASGLECRALVGRAEWGLPPLRGLISCAGAQKDLSERLCRGHPKHMDPGVKTFASTTEFAWF